MRVWNSSFSFNLYGNEILCVWVWKKIRAFSARTQMDLWISIRFPSGVGVQTKSKWYAKTSLSTHQSTTTIYTFPLLRCLHFTQVKYVITNWYFDNCSFSYNYCVKFSYEILFSIPPPHSIPITRRPAALCAMFPGPSSFQLLAHLQQLELGAWSCSPMTSLGFVCLRSTHYECLYEQKGFNREP